MISMTMPQFRRGECSVSGSRIHLSPREAEILAFMLVSYPRPMRNEEILTHLWPNPDLEPENAANIVSVYICRLRKKLGAKWIACSSTIGYRIAHTQADQRPMINPGNQHGVKNKLPPKIPCSHCNGRGFTRDSQTAAVAHG